jgi:plastocyanin
MPRFTPIAVACTALALALSACGKDDESQTGRDGGGDSATVTTNPTPEAGTSTQSESAESNDIVTITMKDIKFVPHDAEAKVGQKVTWENNDTAPHNVTAQKGADFKSDTLNQGATFDYTPTKAGTIEYVCTIHPGQDGKLIVTK